MVWRNPLLVPQWMLQVGMTEAPPLLQRGFGLMMELKLKLMLGFSSAAFKNTRMKRRMVSFK